MGNILLSRKNAGKTLQKVVTTMYKNLPKLDNNSHNFLIERSQKKEMQKLFCDFLVKPILTSTV